MDLATYLDRTGTTQTDFAAKVFTTVATISRICSDDPKQKIRPGLDLAHRIEQATNGQVPLSQWVREPSVPSADAA